MSTELTTRTNKPSMIQQSMIQNDSTIINNKKQQNLPKKGCKIMTVAVLSGGLSLHSRALRCAAHAGAELFGGALFGTAGGHGGGRDVWTTMKLDCFNVVFIVFSWVLMVFSWFWFMVKFMDNSLVYETWFMRFFFKAFLCKCFCWTDLWCLVVWIDQLIIQNTVIYLQWRLVF